MKDEQPKLSLPLIITTSKKFVDARLVWTNECHNELVCTIQTFTDIISYCLRAVERNALFEDGFNLPLSKNNKISIKFSEPRLSEEDFKLIVSWLNVIKVNLLENGDKK